MSNRPKTAVVAAQRSVTTSYAGPLPPAADFANYERTLPGTAERIIVMAEEEAEHRRKFDFQLLDSSFRTRRRGQTYAFVVSLTALAIAGACACFGQQIASIGLAIAACVGLATAFVKKEG
jgi:uncharacterized membrane protein